MSTFPVHRLGDPQVIGFEVDPTSSFANRLYGAVYGDAVLYAGRRTRTFARIAGSGGDSMTVGRYGLARVITDVATEPMWQHPVTDNFGGTGVTLVSLFKATSWPGAGAYINAVYVNSTNNQRISVTSAGVAQFVTGFTVARTASGQTLPAGAPVVLGGRVSGSGTYRDVWTNGVLGGSNTSSGNPTLASAIWTLNGAPSSIQGLQSGGEIYLSLVWNRYLSDDEMALVTRDPWVVFRRIPVRQKHFKPQAVATFNPAWARGSNQIIRGTGL